jgi:hypothetical protein
MAGEMETEAEAVIGAIVTTPKQITGTFGLFGFLS